MRPTNFLFHSRESSALARWWVGFLLAVAPSLGCRAGGEVTALPSLGPSPVPIVTNPTIATPLTNPYYSNGNSVTVTGMCMDGDIVQISGDGYGTTLCQNEAFAFTETAAVDGVYTYLITQMDAYQNVSQPASVIWIRKTTVSAPVVQYPPVSPWLSSQSSLVITGDCESGDLVTLSGGGAGSVTCENSTFSLPLPKSVDGNYNVSVSQVDPAGNTASTPIVWEKHVLSAVPGSPVLVVGTSQQFTLSGGSGIYTLSVTTNNSGGTLNSSTSTYTPGTVSGATDTLTLSDSAGDVITVPVVTVAGAPDHFALSGGLGQSGLIGSILGQPAAVKVVDRYGNPVPGVPVAFQFSTGDAVLKSSPFETTNASGVAEVSVELGFSSLLNVLEVYKLGPPLPDLANSGFPTFSLTENATTQGGGAFGSLFATGNAPNAFIAGDFNTDGHVDVAVVNTNDSTMGVYLGKGKGQLGGMVRYATCVGPTGIATADFNGDGKLDLIVACEQSDSVSLFLGIGDGTFQAATTFSTDPTEPGPVAIVAGDFDRDGKMDYAVVSSVNSIVGIHFGDGTGGFSAPVEYATGGGPTALAAGDLNGDGFLDLVVANGTDGTVSVLLNRSSSVTRTFAAKVDTDTGNDPKAVILSDLTGNGHLDVAVANSGDNNVGVLLNDGTGTLADALLDTAGNGPASLVAGDFNGDGKRDLAVVNAADGSLGVLLGNGDGTFAPIVIQTVGTDPVAIVAGSASASGDANADGSFDLWVLNAGTSQVEFLPGNGAGQFGYFAPAGTNPAYAVEADWNADGKGDLAVVNSGANSVTILLGKGTGLFSTVTTLATGNTPVAAAVGDFNGDGIPDLVVVNSASSSVSTFVGKGDGTFQPRNDFGTGSGPAAVVVADFNGDGYPDLAVTNSVSNSVSILLGNGDGTFQNKTDFSTGQAPAAIATADLNGDGKMDLITANASDGTVSVLLGNGNGTFQAAVPYTSGTDPIALVAADFNGDGRIDIAVLNAGDSAVGILTGTGDGSLTFKNAYSVNSTPTGLAAGDFNGDGILDLVATNGPGLSFSVILGTGGGVFSAPTLYAVGDEAAGVCVGDFDANGTVDLAIVDSSEGRIQLWLGQ